MRFDWTDLRIFLHVCEAGSMTAAAERSHLTLAAVSARMRSLEELNGIVLLNRHARGVSPTAAGFVLARHARAVFEQIQRLERDLLEARESAARRLVLLVNSSALARPISLAVADMQPHEIIVRESPSEASVHALRSGAADFAIVSDAVDTRGLVTRELGPDPLVLVAPRTHALAARESLHFREALAHPWVVWGEQSALSAHLLLRALALGQDIAARVTFPRPEGVLQLVAHGVGVTVLPQAIVNQHPAAAQVVCLPLEEAWARRRLLACHPENVDPLRARLADGVREHWPPPTP